MPNPFAVVPHPDHVWIPNPVDDIFANLLADAAQRKAVEDAIDGIWTSSGGASSMPYGDLIPIGKGFCREYSGGGRIYVTFGSPIGFGPLGWRGFLVYGAIGERYTQLGGPESWLGWPTSSEQDFDQGGRVSTFQNGAIYWWPDTGAIELGKIAVRYTGLMCFGETDSDQFSNSDEPYMIFGVVPTVPGLASSTRTGIYEDVDGGEAFGDLIELYRGLPYGLLLSIVLMEHDFDNPDKYRDQINVGGNSDLRCSLYSNWHNSSSGPPPRRSCRARAQRGCAISRR